MRTTSVDQEHVKQFLELVAAIGRRKTLRDPFSHLVEKHGLGPAQVHAILWLRRDGSLGMGALAQRAGVNQKTVTGIVDRLERHGFVKRVRSVQDRRVVHVALAPKGVRLADQLESTLFTNTQTLLGMLDVRDRRDLFRILENVVATLDQPFLAVPVSSPSH